MKKGSLSKKTYSIVLEKKYLLAFHENKLYQKKTHHILYWLLIA